MKEVLTNLLKSINNNDRIVAGVSGGVDSMVLLHLLKNAREYKNFELQVVHVEHGIRGKESLRDANFVSNYCNINNIDCKVVSANVPQIASKNKQTVEQAAREVRQKAFAPYLNKGYKLFLAHNKNDQAETVLMHIFRGSGIDGARGIVDREGFCRPLLNYTKAEIIEYARNNNIEYVEDSTNNSVEYSRNFIRNKIIPQISQIYPNIVENVAKFAVFCTQAENFAQENVNMQWFKTTKTHISINKEAFDSHDIIVAKVIKHAYNLCGEFADLESKHIQLIKEFVKQCKNGAVYQLPHSIVVENRNDSVLFYKATKKDESKNKFVLGENCFCGKKIFVSKSDDQIEFKKGCYFLDYHKIPQNAVWRTREKGDMFHKLGSNGSKKLNDYFTDKKICLADRDSIVLLASGSNVLAVLGYDIAESVKIDSDTLDVIKIDYSQLL